ncbi:MAG: hypothetical protein A3I88_02315 [Candidatus Portnoybacteria bacterium RIFCSPLOWO2_12_FULL_39_9]|uniref:Carbamoyltransferase n=1 Tax=Candidatus Portnoybacteria bacterium RIFCSPHIGHO2_12_FULL_38_9 TaxID=1801997 RepID=A0A1G2FGN1_9BACT|nr:MAG: hypothetical protein A3J64_03240 [Candidatus Portnoybacteria bacterium RIFCSPHIGHO2_12_FULL_38_9]OGZ38925.1 MAG: hypothetical protein A3F21_03660 [Candidatus Portnoybacteria bacterium RIFCSPLOWO2_01_FULL_38_39]OGZ40426.1 MAG: hypothetical protein A3I88_02315 [Candidatus Portnoybacteria bacterium RIFCSPLOWO2_12_FULL_39_9]
MYILGISCFYHDAAACLVKDGQLVAAAQEERFTRKKHEAGFPSKAIRYCLKEAKIKTDDLNYIGFYDKPFLKFERLLETYLEVFPRGWSSFVKSMPVWLKEKIWIPQIIKKELDYQGKIIFIEHHLSHAASAFLVSPFKSAAILTIDGVGEWATTAYGLGQDKKIELKQEIHFPDSLGLFYSAFTYYLGFKVNSAEYKVMGLAPYGQPKYYDLIMKELIDLKDDGSFKMNMDYFAYEYGLTMTNQKFNQLFGLLPRQPETELKQIHKDIAASLQKATETILIKMADYLYQETKMKNLCLAGGVALNCVANSRILKETSFEDIFIQPAAGDAGGALGAAFYIYHCLLKKERNFTMTHTYWGPQYSHRTIKEYLEKNNISYEELSGKDLVRQTAQLIKDQKVIGWFEGRMEFGPRALGNRSILADARNQKNWQRVNLKIKFRESFRPFAPSVLEEDCDEYFEMDKPSPFMLLTAQVKKKVIPAVTHLDGSARIQTVSFKENPLFYQLIKSFKDLTNVPVIINTSFNVRGEPIVCSPHEAFLCFMRTEMDYLVMDKFLLDKNKMKPLTDDIDWQKEFELD